MTDTMRFQVPPEPKRRPKESKVKVVRTQTIKCPPLTERMQKWFDVHRNFDCERAMKLYAKNFERFKAEESARPLQMFGIERGRLFYESRGKDLASVIMRGDSFSVSRKDVAIFCCPVLDHYLIPTDLFIERSLLNPVMEMGYQKSVAFVHGFGSVLGDSCTGEESDLERMKFMQFVRYVVMPDRERGYMKIARSKWRQFSESLEKEGRITSRNWNRMLELQLIILEIGWC